MLKDYFNNDSVIINSFDGMNLVKYAHLGVDWSVPENRLARGLVLDDDGIVIARPFDKFFNLNELVGRDDYSEEVIQLSEADSGPIEVMDKLDGSLVIVFYHEGLRFASSGSLVGEHAIMFKEAAHRVWSPKTLDKIKELSKTHTLMFEYTSPDNKIVLDYGEDKMRLIGIRETVSGKEYTMSEAIKMTEGFGIEYVDVLSMSSMDRVLDYIDEERDIEGVVILFTDSMKRVKIKTSEYLLKHKEANALNLRASGLTKGNIDFIVESVLSEGTGLVDDLLSRYRSIVSLEESLKEADMLVNSLERFAKDLDFVANNFNHLSEFIRNVTYMDLMNDNLEISIKNYSVPSELVFLTMKDLESFHKAQGDYMLIREVVNKTRFNKLMIKVDEYVGKVSNYNHAISPRSFVYSVLDRVELWDKLKAFNSY